MNYPIWDLPVFGGGFFIAVMAVVHVYVSHFAVGGGLYLVITELKGRREHSEGILAFVKMHSKFFLLLTMVFGGVTGVGIWFTISLLSPSATSILIHVFVFGFAAEWVCFLVEIIALFIYFYKFDQMDPKDHLAIGWIYFIFAWLSLFFINGIIGFMLTPGSWLKTGNFWLGFFNPSFFPSLVFRTALSLLIAGIFGFVTTVFIKEEKLRDSLMRFSAKWLIGPLVVVAASGVWYVNAMPVKQFEMITSHSPEIPLFLTLFIWISPIILAFGIVMAVKLPLSIKKPAAFILLLVGLVYMGSFEWIREAGRRPFLIYDYIYSNSIKVSETAKINSRGVLSQAKWVKNKTITKNNMVSAGREVFTIECLACHSVRGLMNDIIPLTKKYSETGMDCFLSGMGKLGKYMPEFFGTEIERKALAAYIVRGLNHKFPEKNKPLKFQSPESPMAFSDKTDKYVLLAWNTLGMRSITDCDGYFSFSPPGNAIHAQLVKRDEIPEIITNGVEITYAAPKEYEKPSSRTSFWAFAKSLWGRSIPNDLGLSGKGVNGIMTIKNTDNFFSGNGIPVVPYKSDGSFQPYPVFTIIAKDKKSGRVLAETKTVVPVSTELGCRACHGGNFKKNGIAGISNETAENILAVHDRYNKTNLREKARSGNPVRCGNCHGNEKKQTMSLSASIHGFHGVFLSKRGSEACGLCHPSGALGHTRFFRGRHAEMFECIDCHGNLDDNAVGLLKYEAGRGKKQADALISYLSPAMAKFKDDIPPRKPWVQEPDCLGCHIDFEIPETGNVTAFPKWTRTAASLYRNRHDDMDALRCEACHGSPHAVYPGENCYGKNLDNLQPLQYNKNLQTIGRKNCRLCHTVEMEDDGHHPNQL